MPFGMRPFATLRVTAWASVILSGAKNLSDDVGKMARACPEQKRGDAAPYLGDSTTEVTNATAKEVQ